MCCSPSSSPGREREPAMACPPINSPPGLESAESAVLRDFRAALVRWYRRHQRQLPWRGTTDAYRVWVSEIMLQQTQVATVIPYYERFLRRFPDVRRLAAAAEEEVLLHWEGLGYYRRARQMHAAAQRIVAEYAGEFPQDVEQVLDLPGIGRYTAGAILSFAFDQRQPILEANTLRLFSRLIACDEPLQRSGTQRRLWAIAERILPRTGTRTINQALMELGSLVCTSCEPSCDRCPVQSHCVARRLGAQGRIPRKGAPITMEQSEEAVLLVRHRRRVLMRRCGPDERWAGLWDFPRFKLESGRTGKGKSTLELERRFASEFGLSVRVDERLTTLRHAVTRYQITLGVHSAVLLGGARLPKGPGHRASRAWIALDALDQLPLNTTGRKVAKWLE